MNRKKWLEMRHLLKPHFIDMAPENLKPMLVALRDNVYDTVSPLERLRNDLLTTYKTLQRHLSISHSRSRYESSRDHHQPSSQSIMRDDLRFDE